MYNIGRNVEGLPFIQHLLVNFNKERFFCHLVENVVTRKRRVFLVLDELITYYFGGIRITIATANNIST